MASRQVIDPHRVAPRTVRHPRANVASQLTVEGDFEKGRQQSHSPSQSQGKRTEGSSSIKRGDDAVVKGHRTQPPVGRHLPEQHVTHHKKAATEEESRSKEDPKGGQKLYRWLSPGRPHSASSDQKKGCNRIRPLPTKNRNLSPLKEQVGNDMVTRNAHRGASGKSTRRPKRVLRNIIESRPGLLHHRRITSDHVAPAVSNRRPGLLGIGPLTQVL
jgi:hypothetical protein